MEVTEPKSVNSDFIDTLSHFDLEASEEEWLNSEDHQGN